MKILIVEDEQSAQAVLDGFLSPYGSIDMASDGVEAIDLFAQALEKKEPYDLVCMDIMMPNMDGQEALTKIRALEETEGIKGLDGVKLIMVSALDDNRNILDAFNSQCEAYVTKPIEKRALLHEMKKLDLIS